MTTDPTPAADVTSGERDALANEAARTLMAAWEKAEGKPVNVSYVATFADMARGLLAAGWRPPTEPTAEVATGLAVTPTWIAEQNRKGQPTAERAGDADDVAAVHQFHGDDCLCGFSSAVSRDRTTHIVAATLAALASSDAPAPAPTDDWRYCPRCGRPPEWEGDTSPGAPCMGCGRYPAAQRDEGLAAAVEELMERLTIEADAICPEGEYDKKDKAWRVASTRRRVVADLRAALGSTGALDRVRAKARAEVVAAVNAVLDDGDLTQVRGGVLGVRILHALDRFAADAGSPDA